MNNGKTYPIQKSCLYRMRNRRKLAVLLDLPSDYFKSSHEYKYDEHSEPKPNGKGIRNYMVPEDSLKQIQKKLCKLISRIETPDWLVSGKKNNSYINNAQRHISASFVKTMDISSFYDSSGRNYVYNAFRDVFLMDKDIAWIMTDLVTYKGILPTGSPSSQIVIFWAYKDMFEEIKEVAERYGCTFTLYVDDMTFSSDNPIPHNMRDEVAKILNKNGFRAKKEKDHYYQTKDAKKITGVVIKNGEMAVPNHNRRVILKQYEKCLVEKNIKEIEILKGMLCSARQIEPEIFPAIAGFLEHYKKELSEFSKNRYYKTVRQKKRLRETAEIEAV